MPGSALTEADVVQWAAAVLADYKTPEYVLLQTDPLPRNASGKVEKTRLRAQAVWGGRFRRRATADPDR